MKPSHNFAIILLAVVACVGAAPGNTFADGWDISPKVAEPRIPGRTLSLRDCGGVGDGVTLNTDAFARAFAKLAEQGGGTLIVPPGIWVTGPIEFRSQVRLQVDAGAVIQFSRDFDLYPLRVFNARGEKSVAVVSPIYGEGLADIAITGAGVIDGGGDAWRLIKKPKVTEGFWNELVASGGVLNQRSNEWWPSQAALDGGPIITELERKGSLDLAEYEPYKLTLRPRLVRLLDCRRILIEGVTFRNAPNWTLHPWLCEDLTVRNVKVFNPRHAQNSDAIDIDSCRRVLVRGCIMDTGDDALCIKSGINASGRRIGVPTEDVLIEDCTVYEGHGGFTIGSEMSGGVRNVRVNNCTFIGTDTGLRFKSTRGRGGVVEKIYISNIHMTDIRGDAINFNLYYGGKAPLEELTPEEEKNLPPVTVETPQFRDIHVENVICRGANSPINLRGLPEMPLRNISLKNSSFISQQGVSVIDAEQIVFENVRVQNATGRQLQTLRVKDSKLELLK
jgi:polygalacturonase